MHFALAKKNKATKPSSSRLCSSNTNNINIYLVHKSKNPLTIGIKQHSGIHRRSIGIPNITPVKVCITKYFFLDILHRIHTHIFTLILQLFHKLHRNLKLFFLVNAEKSIFFDSKSCRLQVFFIGRHQIPQLASRT